MITIVIYKRKGAIGAVSPIALTLFLMLGLCEGALFFFFQNIQADHGD